MEDSNVMKTLSESAEIHAGECNESTEGTDSLDNGNPMVQQCDVASLDGRFDSQDEGTYINDISAESLQRTNTSMKNTDMSVEEAENAMHESSISSQLHGISSPETSNLAEASGPLSSNEDVSVEDYGSLDPVLCTLSSINGKMQNEDESVQETNVSPNNIMTSSQELSSASQKVSTISCTDAASSQSATELLSDQSEERATCVLDLVCDNDSDTDTASGTSIITSKSDFDQNSNISVYGQSPPAKKRKLQRRGTPSQHTSDNLPSFPATTSVNSEWLKPFDLGWRREIVMRKELGRNGVRLSDIYYYTPAGTKLRSMPEIFQHLKSKKSQLDGTCFTFLKSTICKEPFETVRSAGRNRGRSPRASPPKHQTTTVVKNSPKSSATGPKDRLKVDADAAAVKKVKLNVLKVKLKKQQSPPSEAVKGSNWKEMQKLKSNTEKCSFKDTGQKPCDWNCPGSEGVPPNLPCDVCMCMFHPACVKDFGMNFFTCQACETQTGSNSARSAASIRTNISSHVTSARPRLTLKTTREPHQGHVRPELRHSVGASSHELRAPPPLVLAPSISAPLIIPMSFVQPVCIPVASPLPFLSNAMPIITNVPSAVQLASVSVANDCQAKNLPGKGLVCSLPAVSQSSKQMKLVLPSNIISQLDFKKPLVLKINGQRMLLQSDKVIPVSDGIKILLPDKHTSGNISTMACGKPAVAAQCTPCEIPMRRDADKTDVIVIEPDVDFETSQRPLASQESQNLPGAVSTAPLQVALVVVNASSPALQSSGHLLTTATTPLSVLCRANSETVETEPVQGAFPPQKTAISEATARVSESVVIPDCSECDNGSSCCLPPVVLSIQTTMNGPVVPSKEACMVSSPESRLPSVVSLASGQSQDRPVQESVVLPTIVSVLGSGSLSSSIESTATASCGSGGLSSSIESTATASCGSGSLSSSIESTTASCGSGGLSSSIESTTASCGSGSLSSGIESTTASCRSGSLSSSIESTTASCGSGGLSSSIESTAASCGSGSLSSSIESTTASCGSGGLSSSIESTTASCETTNHSCGDTVAGNIQEQVTGNRSEPSVSLSKNLAKCLACNGFESIHAGFNSMLRIFQYLGVCDLLRIATVCTTWCSASQHPKLWRHVRLRGCRIKNWKHAAAHFHRMSTRQLDLRGIIYQRNATGIKWQNMDECLGQLSSLWVIDFGQCTAKVVLTVAEKLLNLKSITAEIILHSTEDAASTGSLFDLTKFSNLYQLESLKLRGVSGISLPEYSNPHELQNLSTLIKLKNLSLTTLKNVEGKHLSFIGTLQRLTTLELGSCYNWTAETFKSLVNLVNLTSLRLENGGDLADVGLGSALKKMVKLENLELIRYFVADNLAIVFPTLSHLKTFFIWPEIHEREIQVGHRNTIILSAVSGMSFLQRLFWGITHDSRSSGELPHVGAMSTSQPKIPFLLRDASVVPCVRPALSTRLLTINDIISALSERLPDTKIQVFQVPMKDQMQQRNSPKGTN